MDKLEFTYDGAVKELTAIEDCILTYAIQGAGGGGGGNSSAYQGSLGLSGVKLTGSIKLTTGEKIYCAVGSAGHGGSTVGGSGGVGVNSYDGGSGQTPRSGSGSAGGGGGGAATILWRRVPISSLGSSYRNEILALAAGGGGGGGAGPQSAGVIHSTAVYGLHTAYSSRSAYIDGVSRGGGGPPLGFGWMYLPSGNHVRFGGGVIPILRNLKPDNCNPPTNDLILIGQDVTAQQLAALGIATPIESLPVIAAGQTVSYSSTYRVDHNFRIGYWIWEASSRPTSGLSAILVDKTYGDSGRQRGSVNSSFTVPSSFTSTSVLVMGIGDVSSRGATGMHGVSFNVTHSGNMTQGQNAQIYGLGANGGGGAGVQGGISYPQLALYGRSGSTGSSFIRTGAPRATIDRSAQYENAGAGGVPGTIGNHGYAAFRSFKTDIRVKSNNSWIEVQDINVRVNGQWSTLDNFKVKSGSNWIDIYNTVLPSVTNKPFTIS